MKVAIIVGTRPQIIKAGPLIRALSKSNDFEVEIVHTGQHYDYQLTKLMFEELSLPDPATNLNVGSGTHAQQTADAMVGIERFLEKSRPSAVIVPGDTNSALAGGLASTKLRIPFGHVEAGARSYDMSMPEEINRRLLDHCSGLLFAPTENCLGNLVKESVPGRPILTGDVMYDSYLEFQDKADSTNQLDLLNLEEQEYAVLTVHRAENVDRRDRLESILTAVRLAGLPVILPLHPRTRKAMAECGISPESVPNLRVIDPVGYIEMLCLLRHSALAITDSGGVQKDAFWSGVPCVTLRENTEWVETLQAGMNTLVGTDVQKILAAVQLWTAGNERPKPSALTHPFGDGHASERVAEALAQYTSGVPGDKQLQVALAKGPKA